MDDFNDFQEFFFNHSDFNNTDSEGEPLALDKEQYLKPVLFVLIGVVGLFGKGALVYILRRFHASNAHNIFILNLAVADLLFLLLYLPFTGFNEYPFGKFICSASETFYEICCGVSALTLMAMSVHCYRSRQETTENQQSERSKRNAVVAVVIIWAIAVAFSVPTMLYAHVITTLGWHGEEIQMCLSTSAEDVNIPLYRMAAYYLFPTVAVGFFLFLAFLKRTDSAQSQTQKEFSNLVLALFGLFVVCFFPTHLASICIMLQHYVYDKVVFEIAIAGFYLNRIYRCLNPVALYCVSGNFRQLFNHHLLCWCTKRDRKPVADLELPAQESAHEPKDLDSA